MAISAIRTSVKRILEDLPTGVELVAAGKTRTLEEQRAAIEAGIAIVGHNYVQEAEAAVAGLGEAARWHFIGHLQTNKAKKAVELFDLVETVDRIKLARELDKAAAGADRVLPILIEVNSGEEDAKAGVMPDEAADLAARISEFEHLHLRGLMTMGPWDPDPEVMRPYFRLTKKLFDELSGQDLGRGEMRVLSMGMSDSYRAAIEEGATLVRIGTALFGPR